MLGWIGPAPWVKREYQPKIFKFIILVPHEDSLSPTGADLLKMGKVSVIAFGIICRDKISQVCERHRGGRHQTHCRVRSTKSGLTLWVHHQWSSVLIVKPQWVTSKCSDAACRRISLNVCCQSRMTGSSASGHCYLCAEALIELLKQIKVPRYLWHVTCAVFCTNMTPSSEYNWLILVIRFIQLICCSSFSHTNKTAPTTTKLKLHLWFY